MKNCMNLKLAENEASFRHELDASVTVDEHEIIVRISKSKCSIHDISSWIEQVAKTMRQSRTLVKELKSCINPNAPIEVFGFHIRQVEYLKNKLGIHTYADLVTASGEYISSNQCVNRKGINRLISIMKTLSFLEIAYPYEWNNFLQSESRYFSGLIQRRVKEVNRQLEKLGTTRRIYINF